MNSYFSPQCYRLGASAGSSSPSHGEISVKVSAAPVFTEDIRAVCILVRIFCENYADGIHCDCHCSLR